MAFGQRAWLLAPHEITPAILAAWEDLESRTVEPNAFASPHFVLPALRHLDPRARVVIALVGTGSPASPELTGVGVLRAVPGTRSLPLPHFVGYRSRHSLLGGMLLDQQRAAEALDALFERFRSQRWWCHGLSLSRVDKDGPGSEAFAAVVARRGLVERVDHPCARAVLLAEGDRTSIPPKKVQSEVRRHLRRLEERGKVAWELRREGGIPARSVQAFLDLEHRGWKGQSMTSLHSNPADEAFFRETVSRFGAAERAFFTELSVDGGVVATTCNFISGSVGFGFKLGWAPELAKMAPGIVNLAELTRRFPREACSDLHFVDSGTTEGSFIERLWPERRLLVDRLVVTTSAGRAALGLVQAARSARDQLAALRRPRSQGS